MQTVIDLSRLRGNIRKIRAETGNRYCAVVKADAYGHGMACACYIEPVADCFFVATSFEAFELLSIVRKPVMISGGEIAPLLGGVQPQIIPTACDCSQLAALYGAGYRRISVAVNTGMNRLGASPSELKKILSWCRENDVKPYSVYSHVYGGASSANEQAQMFEELTYDPLLRNMRHLYSSCALDLAGYDLFDMTRCGIAMYGYGKNTDICLRARAKIVALNRVSRGSHVGYGDVVLDRDAIIATVACGYADGFRRSDRPLYMRVRGNKCAVVGVPCMDYTMIDVTGVPCRVGEYAYTIFQKEDALYLAECYGTIVYEVLTGFNGRAQRIYV